MKKYILPLGYVCILTLILMSCSKDKTLHPVDEVTVTKATGNIQGAVDAFRHLLGDQLNTTPGVTGGRREINWDGVPDAMLGKDLPADFFNPTAPGSPQARQRGLSYASGSQFRVSGTNFSEVNSNAAGQFAAFSGDKTFANVSSNLWEVGLQKAGQPIPASVRGFGIVFSDVDLPNSTAVEFFNGSNSLGKFFVPAHDATTSFSFLGVYFNNEQRITRVRVSHDGILSDGQKDITDNGTRDLVVLDDLLYSEPVEL